MKYIQILLLLVLLPYGCKSQTNGTYCAEVDYYNSKTGTGSNYTLTAEVTDGYLTQLNFPSGGYIDEADYGSAVFDNNNVASASFKGKTYKVRLIKKGTDCFDNVVRTRQCRGSNKSGSRCKNQTDNASGYCWRHN